MEIIAELGSNPAARGWDFEPYCAAASAAAATHVKVQLWYADHFPEAERKAKQLLEFPRERFREFVNCAHQHSLLAGASVFDREAAGLAGAHLDFIKLAAREQENEELLCAALNAGRPVYRSISDLRACGPYAWQSGPRSFETVVTLFAVPRYPTPMPAALAALARWAWFCRRYKIVSWGWSSHVSYKSWESYVDVVLAARLGAAVIEKHLCLSRDEPEGGHSLLPDEFRRMVSLC